MRTSGNWTCSSSYGSRCAKRPFPNLVGRAIGPAVAVPLLAIALLQEALIVALQLVVEDDAPDMATTFSDRLVPRRSYAR